MGTQCLVCGITFDRDEQWSGHLVDGRCPRAATPHPEYSATPSSAGVECPEYYQIPGLNCDVLAVAEALKLGPCRSKAFKYVIRAGRKPGESEERDLNKALTAIRREMELKGYQTDIDNLRASLQRVIHERDSWRKAAEDATRKLDEVTAKAAAERCDAVIRGSAIDWSKVAAESMAAFVQSSKQQGPAAECANAVQMLDKDEPARGPGDAS